MFNHKNEINQLYLNEAMKILIAFSHLIQVEKLREKKFAPRPTLTLESEKPKVVYKDILAQMAARMKEGNDIRDKTIFMSESCLSTQSCLANCLEKNKFLEQSSHLTPNEKDDLCYLYAKCLLDKTENINYEREKYGNEFQKNRVRLPEELAFNAGFHQQVWDEYARNVKLKPPMP